MRATRGALRGLALLALLPALAQAGTWTQTTQADFAGGAPFGVDVSAPQGVVTLVGGDPSWWNAGWAYRVPLELGAGAVARTDFPVEVELDAVGLMAGIAGTFDPASVRLVELDGAGNVVAERPSLYEHEALTGRGVLITLLDGSTPAGAVRRYHVYFDVVESGPKPAPDYRRRVTVGGLQNGVVAVSGLDRDHVDAQAPLGFSEVRSMAGDFDTVYFRWARFASSLGAFGTPLVNYSYCGANLKSPCSVGTPFVTLEPPTLLTSAPNLKVARMTAQAGQVVIKQYAVMTTTEVVRFYTHFVNGGSTAATGVRYWEGGDFDIAAHTDDSASHDPDGSTYAYDTATPGWVGLRGSSAPTGWDLGSPPYVIDRVFAENPNNLSLVGTGDVGLAVRWALPDLLPGGSASLRLAWAVGTSKSPVQGTLANYASPFTQVVGGAETRCAAASGSFVSSVFDGGIGGVEWRTIRWLEGRLPGATVYLETRSGDTPVPDGTWSAWSPSYVDPTGSLVVSLPSRFLQYRAFLSAGSAVCPSLHEVSVDYDAGAVSFTVELADPAAFGEAHDVVVTAREPSGAIAREYQGTVTFSTTDPDGLVPAPYAFTAADGGTHTFPAGVLFGTPGPQTIAVTDTLGLTGEQTVVVAGHEQVAFQWLDAAGTPLAGENAVASVGAGAAVHLRLGVTSHGLPWKLGERRYGATGEAPGRFETFTGTYADLVEADGVGEVITEGLVPSGQGWYALGESTLGGYPWHAWGFGSQIPTGGTGYRVCLVAHTTGEVFRIGWEASVTPSLGTSPAYWWVTPATPAAQCFDLGAVGYTGGPLTLYAWDYERGNKSDSHQDSLYVDQLYVESDGRTFVALERSATADFAAPIQVAAAELWDDPSAANGAVLTPRLTGTTVPQVHVESRPSLSAGQSNLPAGGQGEWDFALRAPADGSGGWYRMVLTDATGARSSGLEAVSAPAYLAGVGQLAFANPPQTVAAGDCSGPTTVQLQDASTNPIPAAQDLILDLAADSGTLVFYSDAGCSVPVTSITLAAGTSSASFHFSDTRVGSPTIVATDSTGVLTSVSQPQTIVPGEASSLAFVAQPTSTTAGAALSPAVSVELLDAYGNRVTSSSAAITVALEANAFGGSLAGTLTVNAVAGLASFPDLWIDRAGSPYTLLASASGLPLRQSAGFAVSAGSPSALVFSTQPSTVVAGEAIAPAVQVAVVDAYGNVTSAAVNVNLAQSAGPVGATLSGTQPVTSVSGIATFSDLSLDQAGPGYALFASSGALSTATSAPFEVVHAPPARLVFTVQPSDTAAGAAIAPAVQVAVEDAFGNLATTATGTAAISLGASPGGASLTGTLSSTLIGGVATFGDLRLDLAGSGYALVAEGLGLPPVTSTSFAIVPGAPARLAFSIQPSAGTVAVALSPAPVVRVEDASGNLVTGATHPVTLALDPNAPGASLSGSVTVSAAGGLASFPSLLVDRVGSGFTLTASSAPLANATSDPFAILEGTLAFTTAAQTLSAGACSSALRIEARDASGAAAPGTVSRTVELLATSPSLTFHDAGCGAALTQAVIPAGSSAIDVYFRDTAAGQPTLTARTEGYADATQLETIVPAAANALAFWIEPGTVAAGSPIAPAVEVEILDVHGNRVTAGSHSVTLQLGSNPAGGTLGGTLTVASASGIAVFPGLTLDKAGSGYDLEATSGSLAMGTSAAFDVVAGSAASLAFVVQPPPGIAGTVLSPAVELEVRDAFGNPVTDATHEIAVALAGDPVGATLSGTLSVTSVGGRAAFSDLWVDRAAAGYQLVASAPGLGTATSAAFDVVAGAPSMLAFSVQPPNTTLATVLSPAPRVEIQDAWGNRVPGAADAITLRLGTNPGSANLGGTLTRSAVGGIADFDDLVLDRAGVGYTLIAESGVLLWATSDSFDIGTGSLVVTTAAQTTQAGACSGAVTVATHDELGNPIVVSMPLFLELIASSATLEFFADPGCAVPITDATLAAGQGETTFHFLDPAAGNPLVLVRAGGWADAQQVQTVVAGAPAALAFRVQPSSVVAGDAMSPAVEVELRDAFGNRVTTATEVVQLDLATNPGGAILTGGEAVSAVAGVATFAGLVLDKAGTGYVLQASSGGLSAAGSLAFDVVAGSEDHLAFTVQPTSVAAGAPISPAVRVSVNDAFGNVVTTSTTSITLSLVASPGATLGGTRTVSAVAGVAGFSGLWIDLAGTGYQLQAASGPMIPATSEAFDVSAGGAAALAFATQPGGTPAGTAISPAVRVAVLDAYGNTVTTATDAITVSLAPGGATTLLNGTKVEPASGGIAAFSDLSIDTAGSGYVLQAASGTLTGASSTPFAVTAAAAHHLAFTVQPGPALAGAAFAVEVAVQDTYGNVVPGAADPVRLELDPNPTQATLLGTQTVNVAGGSASFGDLRVEVAGTGYGLRATSGTLLPAASLLFDVSPGPAARLAFLVGPGPSTVATALRPSPQVAVQDAYGNLVPGATDAITLVLAGSPAGAVLEGTLTASASGGQATFANLVLDTVGSYVLRAESGALTPASTGTFEVFGGQLAITTAPQTLEAGACSAPLRLEAQDVPGNPLTLGIAVALGLSASSPTAAFFADPACQTALTAPGIPAGATSTVVYFRETAAGTLTLTADATGWAPASQDETVLASAPTALAFRVQPSAAVAGQAIAPAVEVEILDAFGNRTPAALDLTMALAPHVAGGVLSGTTIRTSAAGVAAFPDLSVDKAGAGYVLRVAAAGFANLSSAAFDVTAAGAERFEVAGLPSPFVAGTTGSVTVTARDAYDNVASGYLGTVQLTSSDGQAVLPPLHTFSVGEGGVAIVSGVSLRSAGLQSVTASDVAAPLVQGTQTGIEVVASTPSAIAVTGPATAAAGDIVALRVQLSDAYGNPSPTAEPLAVEVHGSAGAVVDSTSPPSPTPAPTVSLVTDAAGGADVRVRDTVAGPLETCASALGISACHTVQLTAGLPDHVSLKAADGMAEAGTSEALTLAVVDLFGNPVSAEVDLELTVDGAATFVLSGTAAQALRTDGAGNAAVALTDRVAETVTVVVAAASAGGVALPGASRHGSASVVFVAGPPDHFVLTAPPDATAGEPAAVSVQLVDAYGNPTPASAPVCVTAAGAEGGSPTVVNTSLEQSSQPDDATVCGSTDALSGSGTVLVGDTRAGALTVQASGTGAADTAVIQVHPAAPDALRLEAEDGLALACQSERIAVQLVDAYDNAVTDPAHTEVEVTLSAGAPSGTASITAGSLLLATVSGASVTGTLTADGSAEVEVGLDAADALTVTWASAALPGAPSAATVVFEVGAADAARSSVTVSTAQVEAGLGEAAVTITPRDACGLLLGPDREVLLDATFGALTPVVDAGDGTYASVFTTAPGECPAEPAAIVATVDGAVLNDPALVTSVCTPVSPELTPVSPTLATARACASGDEWVVLEVEPRDAAGSPMPAGQEVTVEAAEPFLVVGEIVEVPTGEGSSTYRVQVGSNRCGEAPREVTVQVNGVPLATRPSLTFTCPQLDPAATRFAAEPAVVPADGQSAAQVRVHLVDACGNPAFGRTLSVAPTRDDLEIGVAPETAETADAVGEPEDGSASFAFTARLAGSTGIQTGDGAESAPGLLTFTLADVLGIGYVSSTPRAVVGQSVILTATLENRYGGALAGVRANVESQSLHVLSVEGAVLEGETLVLGDLAPGASLEVRLHCRVGLAEGQATSRLVATYRAATAPEAEPATARSERLAIEVTGDADVGGCECSAQSNGGPLSAWPLALLLFLRRRRQARRT